MRAAATSLPPQPATTRSKPSLRPATKATAAAATTATATATAVAPPWTLCPWLHSPAAAEPAP